MNGTIGVISGIDEEEETIYVITDDGKECDVKRESWRNIRYRYNEKTKEIEEEVLGKMDLLPRLSVKDCAEVVDINGSDKGYMDLYLLAHCKHQITTKGTLGKFGALLADNPDKYVVLYNDETQQYWKMLLQNPVFI